MLLYVRIADALQEWHACTLIMWVFEVTVVTPDYFQLHSAFQLVSMVSIHCLEQRPHILQQDNSS